MSTQPRVLRARALPPAIAICSIFLAISPITHAKDRSGKEVVESVCAGCHVQGKDGAPKIGDRTAWTPRMAKGLEELVASADHGHGAMPSRGGDFRLSPAEIRGAVVYMFNHGLPPPPAPPVQAKADPFHKVVGGTDVYFGMIRADTMRATGANRSDIPRGKGYYHLNISLADAQSHSPVKDAQVKMRVSDGMSSEAKELRPVYANNVVSYGNYFRFASGSAYNIVAEIQRPGAAAPLEARFEFRAP